MSGIVVGVPALERPAWAFVESLLFLQTPEGGYTLHREGPGKVDASRNAIVHTFLASAAEWLLFLDSDAVVHPGTLLRLLSWQQPVVGALAFSRYGPLPPTVLRGEDPTRPGKFQIKTNETRDWLAAHPELLRCGPELLTPPPADSLAPVDRTGCHCLLIHRDVLEGIAPPWFVGAGPRGHGEDFYFCAQVHAAGWPIYVDRSVVAGHLYGDRPLGALDWLVWDQASEYATAEDSNQLGWQCCGQRMLGE